MRFTVLGLGPIGCLIAHSLRRALPASHSVALVHKTPSERLRLREKGHITLQRAEHQERSSNFAHEVFASSSATQPIDALIVALKAHDTVPALTTLAPRLSPRSTIVLLQNGMGVYERLLTNVFRNPTHRPHFILASNTHGAFISNYYNVVHAGAGSIDFGIVPNGRRDFEAGLHNDDPDSSSHRLRLKDISPPDDPQAEDYKSLRSTVAALLLLESLNTSWRPFSEVELLMRRKLAVNAVINPVTALLGCRNGALVHHEEAQQLTAQICREASDIFSAQMDLDVNAWLKDLEIEGVDISNVAPPLFPPALRPDELEAEVLRVAQLTQGNFSSMLQDVRRGKQTEIDFLNGYIASMGRDLGVPTPVNASLVDLIKLKYLVPLEQ